MWFLIKEKIMQLELPIAIAFADRVFHSATFDYLDGLWLLWFSASFAALIFECLLPQSFANDGVVPKRVKKVDKPMYDRSVLVKPYS